MRPSATRFAGARASARSAPPPRAPRRSQPPPPTSPRPRCRAAPDGPRRPRSAPPPPRRRRSTARAALRHVPPSNSASAGPLNSCFAMNVHPPGKSNDPPKSDRLRLEVKTTRGESGSHASSRATSTPHPSGSITSSSTASGRRRCDQRSRALGVSCLADHVEPRREQQQPREPSEARVVIDDQHLDRHRPIVAWRRVREIPELRRRSGMPLTRSTPRSAYRRPSFARHDSTLGGSPMARLFSALLWAVALLTVRRSRRRRSPPRRRRLVCRRSSSTRSLPTRGRPAQEPSMSGHRQIASGVLRDASGRRSRDFLTHVHVDQGDEGRCERALCRFGLRCRRATRRGGAVTVEQPHAHVAGHRRHRPVPRRVRHSGRARPGRSRIPDHRHRHDPRSRGPAGREGEPPGRQRRVHRTSQRSVPTGRCRAGDPAALPVRRLRSTAAGSVAVAVGRRVLHRPGRPSPDPGRS